MISSDLKIAPYTTSDIRKATIAAQGMCRLFSGVTAVLAGKISNERLFYTWNYPSFLAFAAKDLGLRRDAAHKLRVAGESAWRWYRQQCERIIELVVSGAALTTVNSVPMPNESVLVLLGRTLKLVGEHERPALLARVLAGEVATPELAKLLRNLGPRKALLLGAGINGHIQELRSSLERIKEGRAGLVEGEAHALQEALRPIKVELDELIAGVLA
jgi:hypothetical protein